MSGNWSSSWSTDATPQNTPSTDLESGGNDLWGSQNQAGGNNSWDSQQFGDNNSRRTQHVEVNNSWGAQPQVAGSWSRRTMDSIPNASVSQTAYKVDASMYRNIGESNGWGFPLQAQGNLSGNTMGSKVKQNARQSNPKATASTCKRWVCSSNACDHQRQEVNNSWNTINSDVNQNFRQVNFEGDSTTCKKGAQNDGWGQPIQPETNSWGNTMNSVVNQNAPQSKLDRNTSTTKAMGYNDGWGRPIQQANDPWGNTVNSNFDPNSRQSQYVNNDNSYEDCSHHNSWSDQPAVDNSSSGNAIDPEANTWNTPYADKNKLETALATFHYEFTSFPHYADSAFTNLSEMHPASWPYKIAKCPRLGGDLQNPLPWFNQDLGPSRMQTQPGWGITGNKWRWIKDFSLMENGAANLLYVIFWSMVLKSKVSGWDGIDATFWGEVRREAVDLLFKFEGAPEQYLGWIQNLKRKNKGHLQDILSEKNQAFFTINKAGSFKWLSDSEGIHILEDVIGELPPFKLKFI
ncbi:hypothetical protein L207DRAFT_538684 [Hyaloscypha variabilis F]|uniref:Uncharacterized protein n=1 Tax=Hyaloscypha variabilis (strain UAMH 11265 / GT02V1 / F) TaxID=1149755 RepID=A0A2J6QU01_HYAVF|nr:hypothetical protein L207DRAFT_538684 [Hyaloscypha variabilis F]